MELRHLRYFVAVATEANFRRASDMLNVSQPALSKQIKDLEDELGVQLLERHNAGARLTTSGQVFLEEARAILTQVETATTSTQDSGRGTGEVFRLGQVGFLTLGFSPGFLTAFQDEFPQVELNLLEMGFQEQIKALKTGMIDLGLTAASDAEIPQQIARKKVFHAKLAVALGKHHALAQQPNISLSELSGKTLFCYRNLKHPLGHNDQIRKIFAHFKLKTPRIKLVDDPASMIPLLAGGYGITIIPFAVIASARSIVLKPIKESGPVLNFELRAIWLKNTTSKFPGCFLEISRRMKAGLTSPNKTKMGNPLKQV